MFPSRSPGKKGKSKTAMRRTSGRNGSNLSSHDPSSSVAQPNNNFDDIINSNDSTMYHNDVIITGQNGSYSTQFIAITQSDERTANNYLQRCDNDLNQAVALFFQQPGNNTPTNCNSIASTIVATTTSSAIYGNQSSTIELDELAYIQEHGIRPPLKPRTERLVEDIPLSPKLRGKRPRLPNFLISDNEKDLHEVPGKRAKITTIFAPPIDITCKGSFTQVLKIAYDSKKWLLVNVQDYEFVSLVLNRDFWRNTTIREILKQNFILWQIESETSDAKHFSHFYDITCYPWIAIIHPLTRKLMRNVTPSLSNLVDVKQVQSNILTFTQSLQNFIDDNTDVSGNNNEMHRSSTTYHNEDEQFQAAISASLAENGRSATLINNVSSTTLINNVSSLFSNDDQPCCSRSQIYSLPLRSLSPGTTDVTNILIRMPDGTRDTHAFSATHPITELFKYLESKGIILDDYEVVTAYPRSCLNVYRNGFITFEQAKLTPTATVFIQEK